MPSSQPTAARRMILTAFLSSKSNHYDELTRVEAVARQVSAEILKQLELPKFAETSKVDPTRAVPKVRVHKDSLPAKSKVRVKRKPSRVTNCTRMGSLKRELRPRPF